MPTLRPAAFLPMLVLASASASACEGPADRPPALGDAPIVGVDTLTAAEPMADEHVTTDNGWPRVFTAGTSQVTVYQPQVESWDDVRLRSRAAVSVQTSGSSAPIYGVVWFSARTDVDRENRLVRLEAIRVESAAFPSEPERADELAATIRAHMPTGGVYVALDRLQASLAVTTAESKHPTVAVRNDVPRILFSSSPAVLVLIDGQPVLRKVTSTGLTTSTSVLRVINTRALLILDPRSGAYYLAMGGRWMTSRDLAGPWTEARSIATDLSVALDLAKEATTRDALVDLLDTPGTPVMDEMDRGVAPAVYVSTVPTELVQTQGRPQLAPIPDTQLLEVTNTGSDVLMNPGDQQYYALLSGRWYRSPSLEHGPWSFVSARSLPADFARIPESHPKGTVLASVAGTPESQQAIIANEIPQTAEVQRAAAQLTVSYDGEPRWTPIEGTPLAYAPNTPTPVIRVTPSSYYAVDSGVWFTAPSPNGPWQTASSVPDVVYTIPPSSPLYDVTYVRIYDATPEVVHEGYTPGYLGSYVSDDDVVVYGTGYVYPCWAEDEWIGSPWTYGFDVGWAPGFAWGFAWGYGVGLAVGWWPGMAFHPWWGPAGWGWKRHDVPVHNVSSANLYRSAWGARVVGNRWERTAAGREEAAAPIRRLPGFGGVYAGRNGQVFRATPAGEWQRNVGTEWQRTAPTKELGKEHEGRQTGGEHWETFQHGGGFRGGSFHGGGRR